jgi:hypothetical protein
VSKDTGIEPRTIAMFAIESVALTARLDLIHKLKLNRSSESGSIIIFDIDLVLDPNQEGP